MVSLAAYQEKINALDSHREPAYTDPQLDFVAHLRSEGYQPPDRLHIGPPFMKFPCPLDKAGKKKGFCIYHEIPDEEHASRVIGIGVYGNYYEGLDATHKWVSRQPRDMTSAQRAGFEEKILEQQRVHDLEKQASHREASGIAKEIYEAATECFEHAYLSRKQIRAHEFVKIAKTSIENERPGDLIIPVINDKDELMSLEFIRPDGEKRFMTGGKKQGCFFRISGENDDVIYICEGYSTAASVFEATNRTTYISFDCGNLYNVASHVKAKFPKSRIVIAADDDIDKPINAGRKAAEQCASTLGIECIFPVLLRGAGKDWNDLAQSQSLFEVRKQLEYVPTAYKQEIKAIDPAFELEPPVGALRAVYDYYNMTSGQDQRGFAAQAAIACVSVFIARNFRTSQGNLSSIYLLCIGKSSTGKEHARTVIQGILKETNHYDLLGNSGFTSSAGVLSDLLEKPRHINIIDEFGRYLETARKSGDALIAGANTKMMEAFGQLAGTMAPAGYSTLNLSKDKRKDLQNRRIYCPALTLFTITVPDRFYAALDIESVRDGFLGRFLIFESDAPRSIWMPKEFVEFPEAIRDWVRAIDERIGGTQEVSSIEPNQIVIKVSGEADKIRVNYANEMLRVSEDLEKFGLSELTGKAAEIMMRVALIAALARDPNTETLTKEDAMWARDYVKYCFDRTVSIIKKSVSGSKFESDKKEALKELRKLGEKGITEAEMQKTNPFSAWKPKDCDDVIKALLKSELVATKQEGRGKKMTLVYYAIV